MVTRATGIFSAEATTIVYSVVGICPNPLSDHQGFVLVWVKNNTVHEGKHDLPRSGQRTTLLEAWWKEDEGGWYTAIYPWIPRGGSSVILREEMSDFGSAQRLLDRYCDQVPYSTEATDLVCHPDVKEAG